LLVFNLGIAELWVREIQVHVYPMVFRGGYG
jgi:hypothetical protein